MQVVYLDGTNHSLTLACTSLRLRQLYVGQRLESIPEWSNIMMIPVRKRMDFFWSYSIRSTRRSRTDEATLKRKPWKRLPAVIGACVKTIPSDQDKGEKKIRSGEERVCHDP
jgi:hypothetical protein